MNRTSPLLSSNLLSKICFWWIFGLFKKGSKGQLKDKDIHEILPAFTSRYIYENLKREWEPCMFRKHGLMIALLKTFWKRILLSHILDVLQQICDLCQPMLIGVVIAYLVGEKVPPHVLYTCIAFLVAVSLLNIIVVNHARYQIENVATLVKASLCMAIYVKVMDLNKETYLKYGSGKIVNFLSSDVEKCAMGMKFLVWSYLGPLVLIVCTYLIYREVGLASLIALLAVFIMPLHVIIGKQIGKWRIQIAGFTDERIHRINEIIIGIRVIKMYCWEKPFARLVKDIRKNEIFCILKSSSLRSQCMGLFYPTTRIMLFFIYLVCMKFSEMTIPKVIRIIGWINPLRFILSTAIPNCFQNGFEMAASITRIQNFLLTESALPPRAIVPNDNPPIAVKNMCANWDKTLNTSDNNRFKLNNINVTIDQGKLVAVVGSVGCGKTSMLLAILNEMNIYQGSVEVNGKISYASQHAWILSASVRDNIVMENDFNEERYINAIECSALARDISNFPNGDRTLLGERGVNLSGGQKARLNLARAIYIDADIYLLDDPLSAVDVLVGRHIFERCICGFLKKKTRVLVTHHMGYLEKVNEILVLKDGSVSASGSMNDLKQNIKEIITDHEVHGDYSSHFDNNKRSGNVESLNWKMDKAIIETEEEKKEGTVSRSTYIDYIFGGVGKILFPGFLVIMSCMVIGYCLGDFWFVKWEEEFGGNVTNESTASYVIYNEQYGIIIGATVLFSGLQALIFSANFTLSARRLHNRMFETLLRIPVSFFETNPSGRVLNRFSRDTEFMDSQLPMNFHIVVVEMFIAVGILAFNCVVNPFSILVFAPMVVFLLIFRQFAVGTLRDMKRIDSSRHSPIYAHVTATLQGLTQIRLVSYKKMFTKNFEYYLDQQTSARFTLTTGIRWVANSVDVISWLVVTSCIITGTLKNNDLDGGEFGVAISHLLSLYTIFGFMVRESADVESMMTSIERIKQYGEIKQEAKEHNDEILPQDWPQEGAIQFQHVTLTYNNNNHAVLKDINLEINSQEKIGIIGRTGAGKSSLIYALLRLEEPVGHIWIDGVDIMKIGLTDLRKNISIIPQDPVLFSGSLRRNLDPFEEYHDQQVWQALNEVQLGETVRSFPEGLMMDAGECGSNLSVGQRQMVCLARAILRNNKILIIDEATANVDQRTDRLIQNSIRDRFKHCTILCIAHRLQTVIDLDRIMVLDDGVIQQFDSPGNLISDKNGIFHTMIEEMSDSERKQIFSFASISNLKTESR